MDRTHDSHQEFRVEKGWVWSHCEDMVLVQAVGYLALPDTSAPKLVDVASFGHEDIADLEG